MDKNSIIGIALIAAIFITWSTVFGPSKEERAEQKRIQDSTLAANKVLALEKQKKQAELALEKTNIQGTTDTVVQNVNEFYTIENELIKLKIATKGGRPYSAQLKEYHTFDSLPLVLFNGDSTIFGLNYYYNNASIRTNNLFFSAFETEKEQVITEAPGKITLRYMHGPAEYLEYVYTLAANTYQVDLKVNMVGLNNLAPATGNEIDLEWELYSPKQERGWKNENFNTTAYFRPNMDDVDFFNARTKKDVSEEIISTQVDWIAYKDQFFTSVIIPEKPFANAKIQSIAMPEDGKYIKQFKSISGVSYQNPNNETIALAFYFGPNKYKYLKKNYEKEGLHEIVAVGRGIIKWINQGIIINIFNSLEKRIDNYGIIILLLTLIIKIFLLPLTFRSYMSQAKMRVVKPMVDEATKKIPKEKAMERQQATMAIYKKVGVSPMGGCLPMVLQMPILFAMFRFFPGAIELRQESFLWATDLSTYDDLISWGTSIPLLGNHLSLFTLLMTVTTILSMKTNSSAQMNDSAMPGMKTMMYIMPVTFLFVLNDFSAALTYYYFLANLITFGQNALFKAFVNEEEVLKKLEAKKAKPKKKSKFAQRLEEMQKMQQQQANKRK
jgi:YidC/Oxa1 family membrane protein insertase